ncbi:chaplin [Streptomyces europaeiscabiei]|uniref:chaplin n=2 Tax=Streptomyces europaeiscabiei TaxID=146819 RepID=UPI0029AB3DBE|nr:chaplin [Streptomyces europaeiscabiei]MDX2770162.1 chaplin [Streptomyces europaeiscabiei]MDX3711806.1 chaplin [Streptomyces europaeiscabiei]MDX3837182.1 chaplin [Streptomyces europaeiscabiei]MDX3844473.1 chaplin [Streptomyces europaeiscabiei]MDX3870355.1 chaplin [Streptomyces europaeiscabiei]
MRQVTRKGLMTVAAASGVLAAAGGGAAHADSGAQGSATNSPGVLSGNTVQAPVEAELNVCGNTVNVVGLLNPAAGNKCSNGGGKHARGGQGGGGHGSSHGGSQADGHTSGSPGVASGNHVQVPVHVPVNVCGNSVNVIGVGNPATDNDCYNGGGGYGGGGHGSSHGGSQADGHTSGSPGVASGNHVQVPVDVPVNLCGNNISVIGIGNGVTGNDCGNSGGGGAHENPGGGHQNPPGDFEEASPQVPGKPSAPGKPGGEIAGGDTNTPGTQTVTQPDGAAQLARTGGDLPLGLALPVGAGALIGGALIYRKARAAAL